MVESSLLGSSDTKIPFSVALGLRSDGCCGDMSFWITTCTQTCQAAHPGKQMQMMSIVTILLPNLDLRIIAMILQV